MFFHSRAIIPVGSSKQQQYQTTPENYNEDYYETDYLSASNQEGEDGDWFQFILSDTFKSLLYF